jgi:hypothetical protein
VTAKERERQEAIERLREFVKPGDTLTTVLRDRSSSGMSRSIDVFLLSCERGRVQTQWLSRLAATALDWTFDERREAVRVHGAGMDMGFHLVYELAGTLFPYGTTFRCTGKNCPSNVHNNAPYPPRDGRRKHPAGGYSLNHKWL